MKIVVNISTLFVKFEGEDGIKLWITREWLFIVSSHLIHNTNISDLMELIGIELFKQWEVFFYI